MSLPHSLFLVIFGASGDLTRRKLMPALVKIHNEGRFPPHFAIVGCARTAYSDETYRSYLKEELAKSPSLDEKEKASLDDFLSTVYYQSMDPADAFTYSRLNERLKALSPQYENDGNYLFYLATPPLLYELIPKYLHDAGILKKPGLKRIIVEKPFGYDLASARKLNKIYATYFKEEDIYRIDHFLGKETVQNILVLRFSNGIFEPLWNRNYIDSIEISASETLGVENRGKYYDGAGALRDMIQNHLMQLMAFTAMESPSVFDPEPIRDEIVKVFRALRPYKTHGMDDLIVRGQYDGYREEKNVAPDSTTETYVAMKMFIDNWRWSDVPFYIFTGKKLPEKSSEIVVNFKSTPHQLFAGQCSGGSCNKLIIRIQPDESITLKFGLKMPGAGFTVKQVGMDFRYDSLSKNYLPDAYERLLLDAMLGDSTLYARSDALEASWRLIDPILHHWKEEGAKNLFFYAPGEDGPIEKAKLGMTPKDCPCQSCQ